MNLNTPGILEMPKTAPAVPSNTPLTNDQFYMNVIRRFPLDNLGGSRNNLTLPYSAAEELFDLDAMGRDCLIKGNEAHCPGKSGTVGFHPIGATVQWTTSHMDDLKTLLLKYRRQTTN